MCNLEYPKLLYIIIVNFELPIAWGRSMAQGFVQGCGNQEKYLKKKAQKHVQQAPALQSGTLPHVFVDERHGALPSPNCLYFLSNLHSFRTLRTNPKDNFWPANQMLT